MPTPVLTARQCLTEEAARALDDAVTVAKRRNHSQTTSLHAISALLSPSFSLLRDSLTRVRSSAYSPRLQFRALELSVGVSLDRVPSSKTLNPNDDFTPPISNSLMAAIKRSQANQRRQPDIYPNPNINPVSMTSVRVELKHFVLSILDDPLVSRVLGEAGFRSFDIKRNIIQPPAPPPVRCPPLFLCNLMDYSIYSGGGGGDENCRRIGEAMARRKENNNPILIGVCAKDGLARFKDCLEKGQIRDFERLKMVGLEREIEGFLGRRKDKDGFETKIKEIRDMLMKGDGVRLIVNLGELKVLVEDDDDHESVKELVMRLKGLVEVYGKNDERKVLWLIGASTDYQTYSKFTGRFPSTEKDLDLHPLPITNSSIPSSFGAFGSKSSLMGSFVPFGGFFPTQSDFKAPATQLFSRCSSCNHKFESELCSVLTEPSSVKTSSNEHVSRLRKKWDDNCRHLNHNHSLPSPVVSLPVAPIPDNLSFLLPGITNSCSSGESSLNERACSISSISPRQTLPKPDYPLRNLNLSLDPKRPSVISVTTDLGLGTIYASKEIDNGNYKTLFRKLSKVVTWQSEAISRITEIVSACKNRTSNSRANIWLSFLGFDNIGKKKVAEALADAVFGSKDSLIAVDLSSNVDSLLICQGSRNFDTSLSRITIVDHIAQELCKKPHSVVILENIDDADPMVQRSLSRAIQTGKFQDSRGREVGINNVIFVAISNVIKDFRNLSPRKEFIKFSEDRILEARNWQMQISVRSTDTTRNSSGIGVSIVSPKYPSKRKLEISKEAKKKPKNSLDLNLPLEEDTVDDFLGNDSKEWMQGLLRQLDGNVEFKPFDFDALADKLLRKIRLSFEKGKESAVSLEIDYEVMVQIVAAAWCSDKKEAVEEWIEEVLGSSFCGARERFCISDECVVRLASCEGVRVEEWASGIRLPRRIDLSI